jgi:hypothetical protein
MVTSYTMQGRFAIQLHMTGAGAHYDLMLEDGQALATWRIDRLPIALGRHESVPAERLADHRPAYLTYQGPVSRGRGTVRIFDAGTYHLIARSEGAWRVDLRGRLVRGAFTLRRLGPVRWQLHAADAGPARRGGSVRPP